MSNDPRVLDVQRMRLLPPSDERAGSLACDVLIAGGGMGGCAAALTLARAGRSVILTEETDWLGGQITSQGVSALDEHPWIESFGGTRSYYELRETLRRYYREQAVPAVAGAERNPGGGWVSHLCFEPRAGVWALEQMLGPQREGGRLTLLLRHRAVAAEVRDDAVQAVTFRHLESATQVRVEARFVLDATELGDLLPLVGAEHSVGAESAAETDEIHAPAEAASWCQQSFTYPFALELRPGDRHYVARPAEYDEDRERQPFTLNHQYHDARGWVRYRMFEESEGAAGPFWTYRRLVEGARFADAAHARDVAMINWPGNDFRHGALVGVDQETALRHLRRARSLALGFCHWLQSECPRDEGGAGYPELRLRNEVMGTDDGLAKFPYIRESRRIVPLRRIREQDIAARFQRGARARLVPDSVGIGSYALDIHPAEGEERIPPDRTRPFQIPLSALVPVRLTNLLPAAKNLGTTHLTNGAYRLHPIEWAVGEAAAHVALFCLDRNLSPQTLAADPPRLRRLQRRLVRAGVPLHWYPDVPLDHPAFEPAQVLAAWGVWTGEPHRLEFGEQVRANSHELRTLTQNSDWARSRLEGVLTYCLPAWSTLNRGALAQAAYAALTI